MISLCIALDALEVVSSSLPNKILHIYIYIHLISSLFCIMLPSAKRIFPCKIVQLYYVTIKLFLLSSSYPLSDYVTGRTADVQNWYGSISNNVRH